MGRLRRQRPAANVTQRQSPMNTRWLGEGICFPWLCIRLNLSPGVGFRRRSTENIDLVANIVVEHLRK
jgi:hypothetical protein